MLSKAQMMKHAELAIRARIAVELKKANEMFGLNLDPEIKTNLRGKKAGQACYWKWSGKMSLAINAEMMCLNEYNWWRVLDNTISHEIAHLVEYAQRGVSGHDYRFVAIHQALGGTGEQYHNMQTKGGRKEYVYHTSKGDVTITSIRHSKIQKGYTYLFRGQPLNAQTPYSEKQYSFMTSVPVRDTDPAPIVAPIAVAATKAATAAPAAPKTRTKSDTSARRPAPAAVVAAFKAAGGDWTRFCEIYGRSDSYAKRQFAKLI